MKLQQSELNQVNIFQSYFLFSAKFCLFASPDGSVPVELQLRDKTAEKENLALKRL